MELEDKTSSPPVFKQNFFFQDRQMVLETTTTRKEACLIHLYMQNVVFFFYLWTWQGLTFSCHALGSHKKIITRYMFYSIPKPIESLSLCLGHVLSGKNLISILASDYFQKRRGQALLFSFEYNMLPNLISNFNHYMDRALLWSWMFMD